MRLPFLAPVVPPHVFCLLEDGVTYARIRRDPAGFEEARHFRYPANSVGRAQEAHMDITTILVIVLIVLLLGGGGFYGRGRWY